MDILSKSVNGDILFFDGMEVFDYNSDSPLVQILGIFYYLPDLEVEGTLDLTCAKPKMPTLESQLAQRHKELQMQYRTLVSDNTGVVTDRSNVLLDVVATVDGTMLPEESFSNRWVDVKGLPKPLTLQQLLGLAVNEEVHYAAVSERLNKEVVYTAIVKDLQLINTPEVNDSLALDAGFPNLEEFNAKFAVDYEKYVQNSHQSVAADKIIQQIMDNSKVPEVPVSWVESQVESRISQIVKSPGGSMSKALQAYQAKDEAELRSRIRGYIYYELKQSCAVRYFLKSVGVAETSEEAFYKAVLSNITWVDSND
jgi:FKBP-type peptidyl-prolyl cis-trans isomerase (trigger factor)